MPVDNFDVLGLGLKSQKCEKKLEWTDELAGELQKPVVRLFRKRRVYVRGIDDTWVADLVDMQAFAVYNDVVRHLLTVLDIFSKYLWIVTLKQKTDIEVEAAFKKIFKEGRKSKKLWVDKGTEFYNKRVKSLGVDLYSTENEEKSCVVERFNRTMKDGFFNILQQQENISIF